MPKPKSDRDTLLRYYRSIIPINNSIRYSDFVKDGVVFVDPSHTYVSTETSDLLEIGAGTIIMPGVRLLGKITIRKEGNLK